MGKVLFVDDDPNLLSGLRRQFRKRYDMDFAEGGHDGLEKLSKSNDYSVIVSDMRMPDMDGVAFLSEAAKRYPNAVRIMLTGNADQLTAIDAVNRGHIYAFLTKPCSPESLAETIDTAIDKYRLAALERDLLERTLAGSVKVLLDVLRVVNPVTFGRTVALQQPAVAIAKALGATNLWEIKIATLLSSIGWISVPEYVLEKVVSGQILTPEERAVVDRHPEVAYDLLKSVPRLEGVARIIRFQRKNFDGTGVPENEFCAEEDIPLGSRILRVLNSAVLMNRPKRPTAKDIEALPAADGRFDPLVLAMAAEILGEDGALEGESERTTLDVSVARVLPGDILEEDLRSPEGKLLLSAGNEISRFHLAKLRHHPAFSRIVEPVKISRVLAH